MLVARAQKRLYLVQTNILLILKTHTNGRNIVGQQHATLLVPTCCVRFHRTTTMLALVGTSCV